MRVRRGIQWPPNSWQEFDLMREEHTRLPQQLYPFALDRQRDDDGRPLNIWLLTIETARGDGKVISGPYHDMFAGFRAMLDAYEQWWPTRPQEQIYFIGSELRVGARVKVGFSRHPEARLKQLQTAHSEKLQIFATKPGSVAEEEKYHRRWKTRRCEGEWFTVGDCIIDEINRLNALSPSDDPGGARGEM